MPEKYFIIFIFIFLSLLSAKEKNWIQIIDSLQQEKQFADIHRTLWKINHMPFATDSTVGYMVLNAFEHYYYQENFEKFYIKNKMDFQDLKDNKPEISPYDPDLVIFIKPLPWIKRAVEMNPRSGIAQFLLGYYYQNKYLPDYFRTEFSSSRLRKMEKQVAIYYEKAFLYGFRHVVLFKYLGDYYYRNRIYHRAKRFYQWNIKKAYFDPEAVLQLALLYLKDGESQKALSYAFIALPSFEGKDTELQYVAYRIISKANLNLENIEKFRYYNELCRKILPEKSEAYLDLVEYYEQKNETDSLMIWIDNLFMTNPFDVKNYEIIPYYANKFHLTVQLLQLLDRIIQKFSEYDLVQAYALWKKGDLFYILGKEEEARNNWEKSREYFTRLTGPTSAILKKIGDVRRLK
jgi:hypothetical protein